MFKWIKQLLYKPKSVDYFLLVHPFVPDGKGGITMVCLDTNCKYTRCNKKRGK